MKIRRPIRRFRMMFAAAAIAASGVVLADNFVGTDFGTVATNATSQPPFDYAAHGYYKASISVLGNTAWVPSGAGAQGPMRSEETDRSEMLQREAAMRFYPVGGANTP